MPSRGSYQLANQEERKIAQRDQSFKNCVATLFVFFILFMVVLIANLTWRKSNTKDDDKYVMARQNGNGQKELETTTTITITMDRSVDNITDKNIRNNEQTSHYFDRYFENKTTTQEFLETNTLTTLSDSVNTLNDDTKSTDSQDQINTIVNKVQSTEQPNRYDNITGETLFEYNEVTENKQNDSSTMTSKIMTNDKTETDNQISTSTTLTENAFFSNNSSFDQINSTNNTNAITEEPNNITTTVSMPTFFNLNASALSTVTDITKNNDSFLTNNITDQLFTTTTAYKSTGLTTKLTDSTQITFSQKESTSTEKTVTIEEFVTKTNALTTSNIESNVITNNTICDSGHCKQIAARILSYMNHSADPCEDFYEYACGGMVANPQIIDLSLADKAYHRIAKQMLKDDNGDASSLFAKYYNSCIQYENIDINERIMIANEAIQKIGKFYLSNENFEDHENFTNLYAKLLKTYSPLLFDVALDLNENNPGYFTIKVGPVLHKNLFGNKNIDDSCYAKETETQKEFVDLENLYENYLTCEQNNTRFIHSIKKALKILGVFNDSQNIAQDVDTTGIYIDDIVKDFSSILPPKNEIRKAYLMKNYTEVSIDELNNKTTFINWYNLIYSLTSKKINDTKFQVYFYKEMIQGLQNLEIFWKKQPKEFHNAVLGLYAHKLYQDLIISKHKDMEQHCLKVSINLLEPEASNLYMMSLSDKENIFMNHTIKILFDELKKTLQFNIQKKSWIMNERQALLSKLNDLKLSVPEVSYFEYEEKYKLNLSDNYLENSLNLMRRYRSSIYSVSLDLNLGTPKQIWTHYATPFQSEGIAIYSLNLIIIPFGAIDYGDMFMSNDENSFNYLTWATIGNLIARQISHHFDANGMYYWNQTRHTNYPLLNNYEKTMFKDYLTCHEDNYSEGKKNITLPHTSQTISYKISELTLNERLSEIMGLRLTYDTFNRLQPFSYSYLPWLKPNINQSFYLIYAQMYCTKSLLTTSYISLHENEELPSRIRVFISASNNNLLGKAWNCSEGSQIVPSSTCDIFPDLVLKDLDIYSK
ncbi:PREDICTED: neprilysin-2-like isoform X1 [Polistes canadensis]|uniref:neprilysin-2-like isoform X1 n=1 Tax=Polistes canadensis TaxID=91411 RepID=UPI000718EDA9|nr:PREDICTED: neprilysin-2-like isoform X1 [Polistes canadensis]